MSDSFGKREKGEETKYRLDQEIEFKVEARRNKLLGLWLAMEFGMKDDAAADYAKEVVISDLDEAGIEDVVGKVMADIKEQSSYITEDQVRAKINEFNEVAADQIRNEFPS